MTDEFDAYIVVDVEATCDERHRIRRDEMEIIEIGAVRVGGPELRAIAELQTFIRPVRHPVLSDFCTRLTSIRQTDVDMAPGFVAAITNLQQWIVREPGRLAFCSWGDYDRKQILQDCKYHRLPYPMPEPHLNLKVLFSKRRHLSRRLSLPDALREAGLPAAGKPHRGIDDARNIARLLPYVIPAAPLPEETHDAQFPRGQ